MSMHALCGQIYNQCEKNAIYCLHKNSPISSFLSAVWTSKAVVTRQKVSYKPSFDFSRGQNSSGCGEAKKQEQGKRKKEKGKRKRNKKRRLKQFLDHILTSPPIFRRERERDHQKGGRTNGKSLFGFWGCWKNCRFPLSHR